MDDLDFKLARMTRIIKQTFEDNDISEDESYIILASITREMEEKNPLLKMASGMADMVMSQREGKYG